MTGARSMARRFARLLFGPVSTEQSGHPLADEFTVTAAHRSHSSSFVGDHAHQSVSARWLASIVASAPGGASDPSTTTAPPGAISSRAPASASSASASLSFNVPHVVASTSRRRVS